LGVVAVSEPVAFARPELGDEEIEALGNVVRSGWVAQGPAVQAFEESVASFCGADHAVAVSSCTAALHLCLVAAGIGPGDEVVVPSMSFIATANAVVHSGARPVFAEVEADTFNLDPSDVEGRIGPAVRAIVLVHQLGLPGRLDEFQRIARERNLVLIEDAACALGSTYRGRHIGCDGRYVAFSFHPRKLITTGEGGIILTDSADVAERLRRLRHHGMSISDLERHSATRVHVESYPVIGFNYRLSDLQAAVGTQQVRRLPTILARRRELASVYDDALEDLAAIQLPARPADVEWNVQTYAVRIPGIGRNHRDDLMQSMLDEGIATRPGVMTIHSQPPYLREGTSLPVSEKASADSLMLPLHAGLSSDDVRRVCKILVQHVSKLGLA
jgi:perosamine synthetase